MFCLSTFIFKLQCYNKCERKRISKIFEQYVAFFIENESISKISEGKTAIKRANLIETHLE